MAFQRKSLRIVAATLVVYAVLVTTHMGEFWPFSIYPMFSQGGNPWSRALVRDVSRETLSSWAPVDLAHLPGEPYGVLEQGVDPIDLANFVSKTQTWDEERIAGLRRMFDADRLDDRRLLVMRVNGRLKNGDSVVVECIPYVLLEQQASSLHPDLPR